MKKSKEKAAEFLKKSGVKISRGDRKKIIKAASVLAVVFVISLTLLLFLLSVKIETVIISGDVSIYNEGTIIESSGIRNGDGMYRKSSRKIEESIKRSLPMTKKVSVKKKPFKNTLEINIEFSDFEYYIEHNGIYFGVDSNLKVLDYRESKSDYVVLGAKYLAVDDVFLPELSKKLKFVNTEYETDEEGETLHDFRDEKYYDYVSGFLDYLVQTGLYEETNAVFLDEKFNISIIWQKKYKIIFGGYTSLDLKYSMLERVLEEGTLTDVDKALIDLSDPSAVAARFDENLDFSEYIG